MERVERNPVTLEPTKDDRVLLPAAAGVRAGLFAGVMMAIVHLLFTLARGAPLDEPARLVASTILGTSAMRGAVAPFVGVLLHFVVSAALGAIFARLVGLTSRSRAMGIALVYSLAVWALAQFIVLPWVNPLMSGRFGVVWPFFLAHLAYGLFLGSAVPVSDEGRWDTAWSRRQGRESRPAP